jgi:hypothetical protein
MSRSFAFSTGGRRRCRGLRWPLVALTLAVLALPASAMASAPTKVVRYMGRSLKVPASWPVFRLSNHPRVCVRFNRHAVYLGSPALDQQCPPHVAGRTEAILVQPLTVAHAADNAGAAVPSSSLAGADAPQGSLAHVVDRAHGVLVTATWAHNPRVIKTALGVRSLSSLVAASHVAPPKASAVKQRFSSTMSRASTMAGGIYTGFGFDVCSTPTQSQMSAWGASPYHAVGVYIGGVNMACSQYNLTSGWVSTESAAGWHIIPIYVGLQAPSNICGCAPISTSTGYSQGVAAARDAVAQAQARGIGAGNPIYDDMEYYSRTSTNTSAVMSFLSGWTSQLHSQGYRSGVYSNDNSGIADLVARYGSGYPEPDIIWFANWNDTFNTISGYVPAGEWSNHQRVHQYLGGYNRTYGGVTLNIDGDYVDAATAAAGTGASVAGPPPSAPANSAPPTISGTARAGQTLTEHHGAWSGNPTSYSYAWERCNSAGAQCAATGATGQSYTLTSADLGSTIRVVETAANAVGTSSPALSSQTGVVGGALDSSYWVFTAYGNVYNMGAKAWYGSPSASGVRTSSITGMAATTDGRGYWLATSQGQVYAYGDAAELAAPHPSHPIKGIVAAPGGGYWLFTAYGNVYNVGGNGWYGSPASRGIRTSSIVGMAPTADGRGYWLVTSSEQVYAYGDAASLTPMVNHQQIGGIVADPTGGFWLWTVGGYTPYTPGTPWYGSPHRAVTGMTTTSDKQGYWLVTWWGGVYSYGDAAASPVPHAAHPVIGIVG